MAKSLLETFASLEECKRDAIADIDSPLLLAFAALDIAANEAGVDRQTGEHIVACLEAAGVAVTKKSVSRALARAGARVSKSKNVYDETQYKLMTKGKREIKHVVGGEQIAVVQIEAGQPHTARKRLGDLLSKLRGVVRICDPYYGVKTLDTLDHVAEGCSIRFLTAKTSESKTRLQRAVSDFRKERPRSEFRTVATPVEIHDRYVLTSSSLLLLGHGLKDIGGKESFIVHLNSRVAGDLLKAVRAKFDDRWRAGSEL